VPTYDYVCNHCGHRFEVVHGIHGDGPTHCPVCHKGPVQKAFAPPTIHFKGSGWAKKDRAGGRPKTKTANAGKDGEKATADAGSADKGGDKTSPPSASGSGSGSDPGSGPAGDAGGSRSGGAGD
jgi:putative FmdB family regulatory protein